MSDAWPWMLAGLVLVLLSGLRPLGTRLAGRAVAGAATLVFAVGAWQFAATYVL